ncbi:MAG TPA: ferredoxin reductase family protein [Jatrophihabitans sp.]|jgi:predicted ferric reductase|uniref:ferredoxin reductase family protein n=1 Tax=Jatrophihabitans sp. TaxID=1932789 RepID=UPI002E09F346|nr:ferredoxin reductase family protein [Jatrophihabitans sp.]
MVAPSSARLAPSETSGAPRMTISADRTASGLALAVIGVGGLAVIGLWWSDTVFIDGFGSWLTNAGRITGLLAGYVIVVLLALMARVPALEHTIGTDRLARWHAMGGRYTVSLAVAHTLLIIWGYAVTANTGLVHETSSLLLTYPDVLMATVALLLLVAVGVVSARAARRRLSYETWHFIHLYTYLAVALMFAHQFSTGADFITNRPARVLWSAMYVAVGAALVWYRLVVPINGAFRHRLHVVEVRPESRDVVSVYVSGRYVDELHAQPGQFFRWRFLTRDLWWAANPYSLSAAPRPGLLRFTVKIAGRHSAALRQLQPGTAVLAEGPYGSFTAARRRRRNVLLIGAGVGITPMRALLESMPGDPGDITLVYRASSPDDLVLRNEIDQIAAARGARVHYAVGSRRRGRPDPLAVGRLQRLVPGLSHHDVFICGPDDLAARLRKGLREAGVPAWNIHHESFTF